MPEIRTDADIAAQNRLNALLPKLPPYVKTFIDAIAARKTIKTQLAYTQDLKTFFYYIAKMNPDYTDKPLSSIPFSVVAQMGIHDIEEYVAFIKSYKVDDATDRNGETIIHDRRNGDAAVRRKVSSLSAFYGYYYKIEEIPGNPVLKFEAPKLNDPEIVALDPNEIDLLISAIKDQSVWTDKEMKYHKKTKYRDLALYTLLLSTGLRVSEAVAIDMDDLDFQREQFRIRRKGGKYQTIGMNPDVVASLLDYIEKDRPSNIFSISGVKIKNKSGIYIQDKKKYLNNGNNR